MGKRKPKPTHIYREQHYFSGALHTRQTFDLKQYAAWREGASRPWKLTDDESIEFFVGEITWEEAP